MHRPGLLQARARVVAGLLIPALLAVAPSSLSAQSGDQREAPEVRDLDLNGVHEVSRRDLERSIATSESECRSLIWLPFCLVSRSPTLWDRKYLDREELRRDVLRVLVFYWKRGYRDAQVDTSVVRLGENRVRVVFDIREGPPTRIASLRVQYDSTLMDENRVRKLSILRAGDPSTLDLVAVARLQDRASLFLVYENALATRLYDGAYVVPVYPLPAHRLRFEASGLPGGVYLVRAEGEQGVQTRLVTLVK